MGDHTQTQNTAHQVPPVNHQFAYLVDFLQRDPRPTDNLFAYGGRRNPALAAVEQYHPQEIFQFFDLSAKRGLPNVTDFSGMREVSFVRQGDDVTQFLQGHGAPYRSRQSVLNTSYKYRRYTGRLLKTAC